MLIPDSVIFSRLIGEMLTIVNYNNQLCSGAIKINDVTTDGFLPIELISL